MIQATIRGVRLATILLFAYWCILFTATHIPRVPGVRIQHADKVFHMLSYSGLAFLLAWAIPTFPRHKLLNVLLAGLLAISYGIVDEFSQIPFGRHADIYDWIADSIGVVVGLTAYAMVRRQIVKHSSSQSVRSTKTIEALQA
jgi:VanZ family protein